ncbi:hypothetical protein [Candidatus Methylocalor cossyra]|uniref:Uncharacterized protein n=1 Tax=Candidatus Methylocalor cossyra TaxID=3108543 RepID=A0ABP1CBR3_9GAMM
MRTNTPFRLFCAVHLIAVTALATPSFASPDDHPGSGSGNPADPTFKAQLTDTSQSGALSTVKLESKPRRSQLEAELKLPVPNSVLHLVDRATAQSALLTLTFARGGTDYAECHFDFKGFKGKRKQGAAVAGYRIDIKDYRGHVHERHGVCDTDLATPGVQPGIPAVQTGDSVTVSSDTNNLVFLHGTL